MAAKMGRPTNSRNIAHKVRNRLIDAIGIVETRSGKSIAELIADEIIEQGPSVILPRFGQFIPKEMMLEVEAKLSIDTPKIDSNQLKEVIEARRELGQPDLREVS